jgi:hypothetical protein
MRPRSHACETDAQGSVDGLKSSGLLAPLIQYMIQHMTRISVSASDELIAAAADTARREGSTRAAVLAAWLAEGFHTQRRKALADAYDEFYGEPDPEDVPAEVRRERAARFDQRWD